MFSLTYKAIVIWLVYQLFKWAGFGLPIEGSVESAVDLAINVGLAVAALYGRWRKGDLTVFGSRL